MRVDFILQVYFAVREVKYTRAEGRQWHLRLNICTLANQNETVLNVHMPQSATFGVPGLQKVNILSGRPFVYRGIILHK